MQTGKVKKEHYGYEKNGSCVLLAAIEPLTGKKMSKVYAQRTKQEHAIFTQELVKQYPNETKIRLVQDNLNTHNNSSSYENLPADEAFELAQKFDGAARAVLLYTKICQLAQNNRAGWSVP